MTTENRIVLKVLSFDLRKRIIEYSDERMGDTEFMDIAVENRMLHALECRNLEVIYGQEYFIFINESGFQVVSRRKRDRLLCGMRATTNASAAVRRRNTTAEPYLWGSRGPPQN
ncbi:hypothetical protein Ahia01_001271000 [Argonauta hians]